MEAQQHQGKTLPYITVHPEGYQKGVTYPMVILLHGYGANMADLAGLAPAIHQTGYVYACPNAPVPVPIGGRRCRVWLGSHWRGEDAGGDPAHRWDGAGLLR